MSTKADEDRRRNPEWRRYASSTAAGNILSVAVLYLLAVLLHVIKAHPGAIAIAIAIVVGAIVWTLGVRGSSTAV
jgi:hypothetical protein